MRYQKRTRSNAKHTKAHTDYSGQKFGSYTVIKEVGRSKQRCVVWLCLCNCGNERNISTFQFLHVNIDRCICHKPPIQVLPAADENVCRKSDHPLYIVLTGIKGRCYVRSDGAYSHYGGRGISVCQEWLSDYGAFYNWALSNGWKKGLQIDRIDNDGNYSPSNCRIVTPKENCRNKRTSIRVIFQGESIGIHDIEKMCPGIPVSTIRNRINLGWPIEKVITTPVKLNKQLF